MIDRRLGDTAVAGWQTYVPVVRAKRSEWKALESLSPGVRRRIAPIIEFVPEFRVPSSTRGNRRRRAAQTPSEYVRRVLEEAIRSTPTGTRSFLYFGHAGPKAEWNGVDLWAAFVGHMPTGAGITPLLDLASVGKASSFPSAVVHSGATAGLRIAAADIGPTLNRSVGDAAQRLGIARPSMHLVFDLQSDPASISHLAIRKSVSGVADFASVSVLAGVFPLDLTQYQPGVLSEPRVEWRVWWSEHVGTPQGERPLGYGDYTTQCAHYRASPAVPGSVSLRYTTDDAILVFRGRQANSGAGLGYEQIHGHCRLLVGRPDYDGATFSEGDQRIHCWTNPSKGPGNPEQWRTACLVHHMTHVVAQLHDTGGSAATIRTWSRA